MLVMLCIVGKHEDNDNNNNEGVRIIFCSKVKNTAQVLALTHKNTESYKIMRGQMKESSLNALSTRAM